MRPTRRALLGAGGLVLLAGCTGQAPPVAQPPPTPTPSPTAAPPPPAPSPSPAVDPDVALRARAVARELILLGAYDAVLRAVPALAPRLRPVRAEHAQHLAALGTPPGQPTPAPRPPAKAPPRTPAAALAMLVGLERAAARGHAEDLADASRSLAGLLAALSASEASHPVVLA